MLALVSITHFHAVYNTLIHCNVETQCWEDAVDCGKTLTEAYKFVYITYNKVIIQYI